MKLTKTTPSGQRIQHDSAAMIDDEEFVPPHRRVASTVNHRPGPEKHIQDAARMRRPLQMQHAHDRGRTIF